ncbi:MAG: hypothetical protein IH594_12680 [Bacteroidales bacterium]|nr:hypothetical protein [Bacteroidales bacterium]
MKNEVKVSAKSKLKYVNDTMLEALFSFMVIRVESIRKRFGSARDFAIGNDISGVTNGKLVVVYDMTEPPPYLYKLVDEVLEPAGMKEYDDYVIAFEQMSTKHLFKWYPSNINDPIPICDKAPWLGSIVSDIGNYVWDKDDNTIRRKPKTFKQTVDGVKVVGEFSHREKNLMSVRLISPFMGWEVVRSFSPWYTRTYKMDYMTVRAEIEARTLIKDMYLKICEIDENIPFITRAYSEMQEELSLLKDINPSEAKKRAKDKLESHFYKNFLFTGGDQTLSDSSMDRRAIEKIIVAYRDKNEKIYLI